MNDAASPKSDAIGILTDVVMGAGVVEYLERIDATLAPFDGRFLVHGGESTVHEGADPGTIVVIEFGSTTGAADWYRSHAYQAIVALRAANSTSIIVTTWCPRRSSRHRCRRFTMTLPSNATTMDVPEPFRSSAATISDELRGAPPKRHPRARQGPRRRSRLRITQSQCPASAGRAVPGSTVKVLDQAGHELPTR